MTTATALIRESVHENRCVRGKYSEALHEELLVECLDSCEEHAEAAVTQHYWGTTEEGYDWSVRLTP